MLNFPVAIITFSPLENSSSAVIVAVDDVLVAFRNMMEDWVDPAYRHLANDPSFAAANRLRNIGIYKTSTKLMLHSALVWVGVRAQTTPGWADMLKNRQVYVAMEDESITAVGYRIIFIMDADIMRAQILKVNGEEIMSVAATM